MQRLQPCLVGHRHVGAAFEQQPQRALVAGAGCEHEGRDRVGGGGAEVDLDMGEQLDHINTAESGGGMHGERAVVGGGGTESRTVPVRAGVGGYVRRESNAQPTRHHM